jgi:hypothetical protein
MEFIDVQTILTVMVVLTAAALVVFLDCRKKQRRLQPERAKSRDAARPQRPLMLFNDAPIEFEPAKRLAAERPLQPLVAPPNVSAAPTVSATPTVSKPPAAPHHIERETVTIQMNGSANGASPCQALTVTLPAFTIDAALWERLVSSMPRTNLLTSGDEESAPEPVIKRRAAPIEIAPGAVDANYQVMHSEPQQAWPTGMIQQPAFQELLDGGEPFSGLVVSIGVNESDSSMWHRQGLMQSVGTYIAGLLREKEFSCRTAYDEFVVVCCGEQGAQSQRRLNHISERLWDYQLRGIGTCSILFSWGGVEVQDQPLAEAVASAVDRMRETKRAGSPSGLAGAHRKAV